MKKIAFLLSIVLLATVLNGCKGKEENKVSSDLKFSSLNVTSGESVTVPGDIIFEAVISEKSVKLSTLEVKAMLGEIEVASASIRTSDYEANVSDKLSIPFVAGMAEGSTLNVVFEAINVAGESVKQEKTISIVRPALPDVLYLTVGEDSYEMARDPENPNEYVTASDSGFESIITAFVSTSAELSESEFIWGESDEINKGEICEFSGASGISVSFPSVLVDNYRFNSVTFQMVAEGKELNVAVNGTPLLPQSGLLYASINFTKDAEVSISGIDNVADAYNRDFFSYEGGVFKFLRDSGTYDVFYSPKYNYIWIARMDDVAPDCLWVVGHGFSSAPVWHDDFAHDGWGTDNITRMAYAVKIAENKYQCSLYLSNQHDWGNFEFEVYSDLEWGKDNGFGGKSISGFNKGVALSGAADGKPGLTSDAGFQPGYYVIVFDNATGDINLDRKTEWQDSGKSGVFVKGTELEVDPDYYFANIDFVQGEKVNISGIADLASAYNRDFFTYDNGVLTFVAPSGSWFVQYFPKYNYFWISNSSLTYPDCIYILGSGKWAAPVYDESDTSVLWNDVAYNRSAPYFVVAPKIAENTYKATMSMSTSNYNWRVLLEFYSDLNWNSVAEIAPTTISGSAAARFYIEGTFFCGIDEKEDPFVPGNYELTITTSASGADINVKKLD